MKLSCIIVDDEPIARRVLQEFVEDIDFIELRGQAANAVEALSLLKENDIDLIFLDINMPKINGIDFLKSSRLKAKVIITTAYPVYAVEAFGLDVVDYLLKPIAFERFLKSCLKVKDAIERNAGGSTGMPANDHFFIKIDHQIEKIRYEDLLFAEGMMNYVMLHTRTGKMVAYITLKALEEQLPAALFIKVHKSFLVNKSKILRIEGNLLDLGTQKIAISQNLKDEVLKEIISDKLIRR